MTFPSQSSAAVPTPSRAGGGLGPTKGAGSKRKTKCPVTLALQRNTATIKCFRAFEKDITAALANVQTVRSKAGYNSGWNN